MPSVAVLTPAGRGAVASLAVEGPGAVALVETLFSTAAGRSLSEMEPACILFGRWRAPPHEELVVCRRGPDEIEVHCHGGAAASAAILASLVEAGCTRMDAWEWVRCRKADALAVEAIEALTHAPTLRTAAVLLDQYHGALADEIADCAGLLEVANQGCWAEAQARLEALAANASVGLHLTQPFQVVLAGKPNVGKSSLMNALAGYQRSIVYDQPGTTRDIVRVRTAIDGWPVELSDTAGLHASDDRLEAAGVTLSLEHMAAADLVILVFDASQPWETSDEDLAAQWPKALVVFNKVDSAMPSGKSGRGLLVSALTGAGVEELLQSLAERLVPQPPPLGAPVPFLPSHEQAISDALERLRSQDAVAAATALRSLTCRNDA